MTPEAFASLCGPTLYHVTAAQNVPAIRREGLLSAADLARHAGVDPRTLVLRQTRMTLPGGAVLNHQLPLRKGRARAAAFLDGTTIEGWAQQLDTRVYLAPRRKLDALQGSFDVPIHTFKIDSAALFAALSDYIDLSPINSGNADRRPARRGEWIYVPATAPAATFRDNRRIRGLVTTRDSVREVSITCPVPPETLDRVLQ
ncbi:hypothetical protein KDD17_07565 [Sulfitobacter albidus]|uniref:Uncharacterized protein n=1 Tax=Sulfitobacter albidus TaxID=2829501 RepID=A0A975JG25_9RHOB|nr:hypothetical protein [Sulfitobacter albidus]QUJ77788.1 hypothetical protein KDD17_07565 [Sulfitobacter albidus]